MRIAIVGGSLGGLFAAALLGRSGHGVLLFERSRSGLEGRGAGLVGQRDIFAILRAVGCEHVAHVGVVANERITLDRDGGILERQATPQMQISWDHLYRSFRDLLADGVYRGGRTVAAVGQNGDSAWLVIEDGTRVEVDLLVGADGLGSIVRRAVAQSDQGPQYAGYVAWRGLLPEGQLPAEAAGLLLDRFAFYPMAQSHMLGFMVAGPHGEMAVGQRRYNWVWYRREDDLARRLTDRNGLPHSFSLAPGMVPDGARDELLEHARHLLPDAFRQVIEAEPTPFIQAIFDYEAPRMAQGRMVLLGDAAFVVRPHTANGAAKAAGDAMTLRTMLEQQSLGPALAAYEAERMTVGETIAAQGHRLARSLGIGQAPL